MNLSLSQIKNITILGCGTLGLRIGLRCALDGFQVCIYDISSPQIERAKKTQEKILVSLLKKGLIEEEGRQAALNRIRWTQDPHEAANGADLMSESVTEQLELKRQVYEQFAPLWPEHTLLTTNTSYLLPSQLAEASGRPKRFCALHFHDVFTATVVDIMPHPHTAAWIPPLLMDFGKSIQQIPVLVQQETPGYVFNAMLMAILGMAGALYTKDLASVEDIDRSWMGNMNTPVGPFGMMDQIGLDTAYHVVSSRKDPRSIRFAEMLKTYVDAGKLGVKTGEGFYQYPRPAYQDKSFLG